MLRRSDTHRDGAGLAELLGIMRPEPRNPAPSNPVSDHTTTRNAARRGGPGWRVALAVSLFLLSLLLIAVPFLTTGGDTWLGLDWIDGRKLYSIDDAYRFFVARNAFRLEAVFLWNYVLPLALSFDAAIAAITDGNLLIMRTVHAGVGMLTLVLVGRASLKAGCGPVLALASVLIVGLMPLYVILSSSFYGEALFAFMVALAFVLLIEEKLTPLAIVVGLSPLVRPEGAIYCVLFLGYFALRRDATRCTLVALPGLIYLAAVVGLSPDWQASMSWRLELREILAPLDTGNAQSISFDRLLNPLWAGLALASLFIRRYRQWWPILFGPVCVIAIQAIGIVRGVQDYELRYYFSLVPIFGVAWAFPIRSLLDSSAATPLRRNVIATATGLGFLAVVTVHSFQSDWVRDLATGTVTPRNVSSELGARALRFDPEPLRAFAGRVDAYVVAHDDVRTVFIADHAPLYFLDFVRDDAQRELVLIPHDPGVAMYSGGFFFGFSLQRLAHRYYRFEAVENGPAVLIVDDRGRNPFFFPQADAPNGVETTSRSVAANIQSGSLKAFSVLPSSRDDVVWSVPERTAQ